MTGGLRASRRLATRLALPSLVLFLAIAFAVFASTWADPAHRTVGIPGDSYLFIWFIRWTAFAVSHQHNPLVSTWMNYPYGLNIMWNTSVVAPGALMTPVSVSLGPVVAFNLLMTLGLALSAWTAMLAIRWWVPSTLAATIGGLVYGFSPYMFAHAAGHLHLVIVMFPPVAMLLLSEILAGGRSPAPLGALLGAASAVQLLVSEEVLAATVVATAVVLAWVVVVHRFRVKRRLGRFLTAIGAAAVIGGMLAAIPLWIQFRGPQRVLGDIQPHNVYVNDLLSFVVPTVFQALAPTQALATVATFTGNAVESNGYLGVPLIVSIAITVVLARRRPIVLVAALAGLTVAILSMGPRLHLGGADTGIHLPDRLIDRLPVLGSLLPSRLGLFVYLAAALLLAVFVKTLLDSRRRVPALVGAALVAASLAALFPALPYLSAPATTPDFFHTTAAERLAPGEVMLVEPAFGVPASRSMLWQAESGMRFRITSGYAVVPDAAGKPLIGSTPSALGGVLGPISAGAPSPPLDAATRAALNADLAARQVRAVVVGPMDNQAETIKLFADLLGRQPAQEGGVYVWWLT